MASLPAESKLSSAKLPTSVTLRVSHSSMPKIASQENQKNTFVPIHKIRLSQRFMGKILGATCSDGQIFFGFFCETIFDLQ
jgi:hypothetical protein